ncbi:Autophagy-related protein [Wickerhamomyces ciferrii]|uniref:Ubiquitin-like protein ATG12 n=1 Tax=Wickerhamomyces ciferrii (strain ATCC 14091 / BCRC 22168 / CBS 111 / JCM 3599 / NBRC 0793 / NRRL Y-1031 F-60-10) TaxID=1206466 RepID=K0KH26_WICCF|nr:Autophagy-related protein [Wickerhamomyces ciferrii]CCH40483.1 Autophagy-related protein [Wickerhamomyces ciferrii]
MDLLVSEDDSSSSESVHATRLMKSVRLHGVEEDKKGIIHPEDIQQTEFKDSDSDNNQNEKEEDEDEEDFDNGPGPLGQNDTPAIKSQTQKHKVTTSASVILNRLPPSQSQVVQKITQESTIKITIRCQPIGSTPQLSPTVFKISETQPFGTLVKFINKKLRKSLKDKNDTIHCYVNNSFAPSSDEIIGNLHKVSINLYQIILRGSITNMKSTSILLRTMNL